MKLHYLSKYILLAIIILFSLFGCTTTYKNEDKQKKALFAKELKDLPTTNDQRAAVFEKLLLARIAAGQGQFESALQNYLAVLEKEVTVVLINEALAISEKLNDHANSLLIAKLWAELKPDAVMPWEVIAFYSLSNQQHESALLALEKVLEKEVDYDRLLRFFNKLTSGHQQKEVYDLVSTLADKYPENMVLPLVLARIHQLQNRWDEALALTANVIKAEPELLIARKYHGSSLILSGQKEEAIAFFIDAVDTFPDAIALRYSLGQVYYDLNHYSKARKQFQKITERSPNNYRSQYMIAACYYSEKNYPLSRQYFESLLRIRSHRNPALFYMGEMARKESDLKSAINFYRQIQNSRYFVTAHSLVAKLLQEQGKYVEAIDYLLNIKTTHIRDQISFKITRLKIMYHQGDFQQAEQYLSVVLEQHPKDMDVQLYRLQWMIERDQPDTAIASIPEIISLFTESADKKSLTLNAAAMLQEKGLTESAINILNENIPEKNDIDFRYMRALFAAESGDVSLAEKDLRYILSVNPVHVDALNALGYTLADNNRKLPEALRLIEQAYSTNSQNPAIVDSMGWIFYRMGDLQQALDYLQQAYKIDPSDEIAAHLAEVLWETGNKSEAKKILFNATSESPDSKAIRNTIEKYNITIDTSPDKP